MKTLEKENDNRAKLENGEIIKYDFCDKKPGDRVLYDYIGKGVIYSHNGVLQHSKRPLHFYKLKQK